MGKKGEHKTEYTQLREEYNLTKTEVANELGMSLPAYSVKERGERNVLPKTKEKFFYQLGNACHKIRKRKKEWSESLELNTYVKTRQFSSEEEEMEDEKAFKLHYPLITVEMYATFVKYIQEGCTVVQVAVREGIDEEELRDMLDKDEISYEYDTTHRVS